MFVNQFAISMFGSVLAMATVAMGNDGFTIGVSIFAILFYLFLIYNMTWEIGARDKISADAGKKKYSPMTGLYMSLIANSLSFVIAIVYTIGYPFMAAYKWAVNMCTVMRVLSIFANGMYLGLMSAIDIGGKALNQYWFTYFLVTVPALVTAGLSYYIGTKDFKFTSLFTEKKDITRK
jgi:hypothetical protein